MNRPSCLPAERREALGVCDPSPDDVKRVGAFGHSNGGATSATAMRADHRIRAGVNLDGAVFGPVVERGLDPPFGTMHGAGDPVAYASLFEFRSHLRGFRPTGTPPRRSTTATPTSFGSPGRSDSTRQHSKSGRSIPPRRSRRRTSR
jgi:hypothetical protein